MLFRWLPPAGDANLGVVLKCADGMYIAAPRTIEQDIIMTAKSLGAAVAFTMCSEMMHVLLQHVPSEGFVRLQAQGIMLPIVNTVSAIISCPSDFAQFPAIISRDAEFALVWSPSIPNILIQGQGLESGLFELVFITG